MQVLVLKHLRPERQAQGSEPHEKDSYVLILRLDIRSSEGYSTANCRSVRVR